MIRMMIRNKVNLKVWLLVHDLVHVHDMEVDGPEYMDTEVAMTSRNMKRESDVPLENLEDEIRKEMETDRQKMSHVLSSMVSAAFGVSAYVSTF